ncbi:ATP-binding protein [Phenylobacterium sp. LjRoot219]|uniref:ATP-binding protein n=1 Tax=Phenylobacterium sp. LjRoot219 TaxID=3342283 RepID=UPI003ECDE122
MSFVGRGLPTVSLFVRLLIFAFTTLLAANAISVVMLFKLPPPMPDFYRVSEVEQALRGAPVPITERRPLQVRTQKVAPGPSMDSRTAPLIRDRLADNLKISQDRIVIAGDYGPLADRRVFRTLRNRLEREGATEEQFLIAPFKVGVRQSDGLWRVVEPQPSFGLSPWERAVILWLGLSTLAITPIAYIYARRLAAPTKLLACAAERLGRDPQAPPLEVRGSPEITMAAAAFNDMQEKLRRYVQDRTGMVGAVAHDLRTPLTRLRFRIESVPDEQQRAKMEADIEQMEAMISATLAFVRDAARPSERTRLELCSLLESLCDEMAETGADTDLVERGDKVVIVGDPMALRRLFSNLLENAVKFGGRARAKVSRDGAYAVVDIADDGPGIPQSDIERVFEPFYRREPSRSRQTGGIGLGLAVVRSIARGHGGDVILLNRSAGGLIARVQLPL